MKLSKEQSNRVYDILVADAGAPESERNMFVHAHTDSESEFNEYRFQGKFGFGGKFWSHYLDVNYYSEDNTKELDALQEIVNDKIMLCIYGENIGKKVQKDSKPFKSGSKINTVEGLIRHLHLRVPAYTFEEDDSYVECRRCNVIID